MKKYIKPEIEVVLVEVQSHILAGSLGKNPGDGSGQYAPKVQDEEEDMEDIKSDACIIDKPAFKGVWTDDETAE